MATLQADDVADLVVAAQNELGRMRLTDLASDLQYKVALSRIMRKERVTVRGGRNIQFNVLMNGDDNTRNVGMFDVDNLNQQDGLQTGEVPWRHTTTGTTWDLHQPSIASGAARLLDFVAEKRYMMQTGWTEQMEANFWDEPDSSTDATTPFGIKYWLVYNATAGFNGANNSNFSSGPAGISRSDYARWKNYTFKYTNVTKDDLVDKARTARWKCGFRPSVENRPIPGYGTGNDRYGQYTTWDTLNTMIKLVEDQNDNLGNDLASKDGVTTLGRVPVEAVPYLQENESTADPFIGIDWNVFRTVVLSGWFLKEGRPRLAANQHNVMEQFLDMTYNWVCYDCRRLFLGAKSSWH